MAHTATNEKERYDSPDELTRKIALLAEMVRESEHIISFTGAGISTSAGIPDFRGPEGKWTREAKGLQPKQGVSTLRAVPTYTHMALVELLKQGKLQYLVSQNCDGLHRRSGVPPSLISELHGNSNIEECESCGQQYFRDMACHRQNSSRDHGTGRGCVREGCGGRLLEYTIDFGQQLPRVPLKTAYKQARKSDLCLALGSSLTVSPANEIPEIVAKRGKLVIVNLQDTPLTEDAALHIYAPVDVVIQAMMSELGYINVPQFRLQRRLGISAVSKGDGTVELSVRGCDSEDTRLQVDTIRSVKWCEPEGSTKELVTLSSQGPWWEPGDLVEVKTRDGTWHAATVIKQSSTQHNSWDLEWKDGDGVAKAVPLSLIRAKGLSSTFQVGDGSAATIVPMHLNFFGHYEEKGVKICSPDLSLPRGDCEEVHHIEYDLEQEEWHCVSSELVSESHINQSNTSSNPAGNEYGTQHRDYVVQGVLEHNEQVTEKEAQAWFDTHCEKNRAKLDFGPNFE